MDERNILEDDPALAFPKLTHEDYYTLNSQSAYNKHLVEKFHQCGCFHCGNRFTSNEITQWLKEADGDDTALCPYCGVDAVIVGTKLLPLSTALLSMLYVDWFSDEYKKAVDNCTYVPTYSDYADYYRKGVPFRLENDESIRFVGEISLWLPASIVALMNEEFDMDEPIDPKEREFEDVGGVVSVKAYFNEKGRYTCKIKDEHGNRLPHTPFRGVDQDTLLELTEEYGDSLRGVLLPNARSDGMRLFVEESGIRN